jgi:hypothetical protein
MLKEDKKIRNIIIELVSYYLEHGSVSINIKLDSMENKKVIQLITDSLELDEAQLTALKTRLSMPRQPDIEGIYSQLVGTASGDSSLYLVGTMVDNFELEYDLKTGLKVILYRNKS